MGAALGALGRDRLQIVHCWTAEPDEAVRRGRLHLEEYQELGFYSLLFLAQALGAQSWLSSCHIGVVSSNVHEVIGTEILCPEKATVAGPCKVIPLEYEGVDCSHIDVMIPGPGTIASRLLVDLLLETLDRPAGDVIAIRGRHRWRPKLIPVRLNRPDTAGSATQAGSARVWGISTTSSPKRSRSSRAPIS